MMTKLWGCAAKQPKAMSKHPSHVTEKAPYHISMTLVFSSVHLGPNNYNYNNINGVCVRAYNVSRHCAHATMPVQIIARMCKFPDKDQPNGVLVFCYGYTVGSHYYGHLWDWPKVTVTVLSGLTSFFTMGNYLGLSKCT